jgi:hypothetical protein
VLCFLSGVQPVSSLVPSVILGGSLIPRRREWKCSCLHCVIDLYVGAAVARLLHDLNPIPMSSNISTTNDSRYFLCLDDAVTWRGIDYATELIIVPNRFADFDDTAESSNDGRQGQVGRRMKKVELELTTDPSTSQDSADTSPGTGIGTIRTGVNTTLYTFFGQEPPLVVPVRRPDGSIGEMDVSDGAVPLPLGEVADCRNPQIGLKQRECIHFGTIGLDITIPSDVAPKALGTYLLIHKAGGEERFQDLQKSLSQASEEWLTQQEVGPTYGVAETWWREKAAALASERFDDCSVAHIGGGTDTETRLEGSDMYHYDLHRISWEPDE